MGIRSHVVEPFVVGARSHTICFVLESAHKISFLPSPSTSTKLGDSLPIPTVSEMMCFFQYPSAFLGFSYHIPGVPGKPMTIRSIHSSRFTSILKLRNEVLYSFAGLKGFPSTISCFFQSGASNQKAPAKTSILPSLLTSPTATPSERNSFVKVCFLNSGDD